MAEAQREVEQVETYGSPETIPKRCLLEALVRYVDITKYTVSSFVQTSIFNFKTSECPCFLTKLLKLDLPRCFWACFDLLVYLEDKISSITPQFQNAVIIFVFF